MRCTTLVIADRHPVVLHVQDRELVMSVATGTYGVILKDMQLCVCFACE
jgi:hypothetical protein